MPFIRQTPHIAPPKWGIRDLRKARAAHAIASMEERVLKAEQELERIEQAIEVLRDQVRAVQGRSQSATKVGPVLETQASLAHSYAARRWELQREADLARQRLDTERRTLQDLKRRLKAAGY